MRILQVHNEYREPGGEDKVVQAEARLLIENGFDLIPCIFKSADISGSFQKFKTAWNLSYSEESKQIVAQKIRDYKPDLMHVHNFFPLATPSIFEAAKEAGIPVVLTLHNYRILCANGLLLREHKPCELCIGGNLLPAFTHACYQDSYLGSLAMAKMIHDHQKKGTWHSLVDRFLVLTDFAKSRYASAGMAMNKFTVKPNFIFDPLINMNFAKKPAGPLKLLFVGRLSAEKGIRTLLEAKKKNKSYELHIIGDGPMRAELRAAIEQDVQIKWHGYQNSEQVYSHMRDCDLLVFPSECYENFPIVLLEAMAHAKAIVASRIGGIPEIIQESKTGFFFEPGNAQSLAAAIESAFLQPARLLEFGNNARTHYLGNYGPQNNLEQLLAIYRREIAIKSGESQAKE